MKKVEGWKAGLFVGGLILIAIVISVREESRPTISSSPNYVQQEAIQPRTAAATERSPQVDEAKAREQKLALARIEAEEKAARHARFLTRNINPGFTKEPHPTFAVVAAMSDGKLNFQMTSSLIRRLATNDLRLIPSFFTLPNSSRTGISKFSRMVRTNSFRIWSSRKSSTASSSQERT